MNIPKIVTCYNCDDLIDSAKSIVVDGKHYCKRCQGGFSDSEFVKFLEELSK